MYNAYRNNQDEYPESSDDDEIIDDPIEPQELPKLTVFNRINVVRFEYEIKFDHFDRRPKSNSSLFSPPGQMDPLFFVTLENNSSLGNGYYDFNVSLNLNLKHTKKTQEDVDFKCSVLGKQGEKLNTKDGKIYFYDETTVGVMFTYKKTVYNNYNRNYGYNYGHNHRQDRDPLERIFKKKVVTFHCEFTMDLEQCTDNLGLNSSPVFNQFGAMNINGSIGNQGTGEQSLSSDMEALWSSSKNSDFEFKFPNGKKLKAHKLILGTRSAVFGAMFEHHSSKEVRESRVEIVDSTVEAFDAFLYFLYTGKCSGIENFGAELLALADKYQVNSLKTISESHLCSAISPTNMFNLLLLADSVGALKLKAKVVDYISKNSSVQDSVKAAFSLQNPEQLVQQIRALTLGQ